MVNEVTSTLAEVRSAGAEREKHFTMLLNDLKSRLTTSATQSYAKKDFAAPEDVDVSTPNATQPTGTRNSQKSSSS